MPTQEEINKKKSEQYGGRPRHEQRGLKQRPADIPDRRAVTARAIAKHPEIVEKVKAQARENEDIPTRTAVISEIRYQKEKEINKQAKENLSKLKGVIAIEQVQYINALDKAIRVIPINPPEQWNEDAFKEAKSKAQIIIKRLEVFKNDKKQIR